MSENPAPQTQLVGTKERLSALIDEYFDIGFDEGVEGRVHDTPDGKAQKTRSEIDAIIADLATAPQTNVKVKPLEWNGNSGRAVLGSYHVTYNVSGQPWGYSERSAGYYAERDIGFGQLVSGPHETRKDAEQSADADYESRILSALASEGQQ